VDLIDDHNGIFLKRILDNLPAIERKVLPGPRRGCGMPQRARDIAQGRPDWMSPDQLSAGQLIGRGRASWWRNDEKDASGSMLPERMYNIYYLCAGSGKRPTD